MRHSRETARPGQKNRSLPKHPLPEAAVLSELRLNHVGGTAWRKRPVWERGVMGGLIGRPLGNDQAASATALGNIRIDKHQQVAGSDDFVVAYSHANLRNS